MNLTRLLVLLLVSFALITAAPLVALAEEPPEDPADAPEQVEAEKADTKQVHIIGIVQPWARFQQLNPGTTVRGEEEDTSIDFGLRRARLLLWAEYAERFITVFHIGINSQTFRPGVKYQPVVVHDAFGQVDIIDEALSIGAGLHYWRGVSRLSTASTTKLLAVDAPLINWATIERADQVGRFLGLFAKGKLGSFDYRVALNKPFVVDTDLEAQAPNAAFYNPRYHGFATSGYVMWQMLDQEANTLPYLTMTYLGEKKIFNLGVGAYYQPDGMASLDETGALDEHDLLIVSADAFADVPTGAGSSVTAYGAFYHMDFGPNHLRNIGVMPVGEGGTSFNGSSNAYPTIGTGEHVYAELGYLLPQTLTDARLQPFLTAQWSFLEALDDPSDVYGAGVNWFLAGHAAKLTAQWRLRPIFEATDEGVRRQDRLSEVIVQSQFLF